MSKLLQDVAKNRSSKWQDFQGEIQALKLKRTRVQGQLEGIENSLADMEREIAMQDIVREDEDSQFVDDAELKELAGTMRIVMITGFESFNSGLYTRVGQRVSKR